MVNEKSSAGAHLQFEQIQLIDCYWDESEPLEKPDQIPDRKPDFQFQKSKQVGLRKLQVIDKYKPW